MAASREQAIRELEAIKPDWADGTAVRIGPGVTLQTLDGAKVGNGIVVKELEPQYEGLKAYLDKSGQKLWLVETDFGNTMKLCDNEIHELYGLGYQTSYERWWDDRLATIKKTVEES